MTTIEQLLNRDLIQIDDTNDFSQVKIKLQNNNPTVLYVANKKDIVNNNLDLNFVRIVVGIDFHDVESKTGIKRFTDIDDAIKYIQDGLNDNKKTSINF